MNNIYNKEHSEFQRKDRANNGRIEDLNLPPIASTGKERISRTANQAVNDAHLQQLIKKEVMRQIKEIEPVYKLVHEFRQQVSKILLQTLHDFTPAEMGFRAKAEEPMDIKRIMQALEAAALDLNACYENMQGGSSEFMITLRKISLKLQSHIENAAIDLKLIAPDGYLGAQDKTTFFDKLLALQMITGEEEINLEMMRGRIN